MGTGRARGSALHGRRSYILVVLKAEEVASLEVMPQEDIPAWDGDPASFENFATSCRWYECSLKDTEKKLAAPRIWQRLAGAAKSVVKHLDPKDFATESGLQKLLTVLRESPLQKLPVPDSFARLERWTGMRRTSSESIPQLLVREEELFLELQQALKRARHERRKAEMRSMAVGVSEHDPSASPTRSPNVAGGKGGRMVEEEPTEQSFEEAPTTSGMDNTGFFENELRGYRLLKASKLTAAERQHVLTLTKNSTHFTLIRQALRSLFAETDGVEDHPRPRKTIWFEEPYEENDWDDEWWDEEPWPAAEAYWSDWPGADSWEDYEGMDYKADDLYGETPENDLAGQAAEQPLEEEQRLEEAFALATEANKILAEAKQAVARVRAARGYYDTAGHKGTGPGKGKGKPFGGKGKGPSSFGPCFICGQNGHGYQKCPDRWSRGGKSSPMSSPSSKGSSFGSGKGSGRPKGKGKKGKKGGKVYTMDFGYGMDYIPDINVLSLFENEELYAQGVAKAVLDTGATESVAGVESMARVLDSCPMLYHIQLEDRPRFRFGNGENQRAVSKIYLYTPAIGKVTFYLLDGSAERTPLLLGARDLRSRKAVISYHGDYLAYRNVTGQWMSTSLTSSQTGGHLWLDLMEQPVPIEFLLQRFNGYPSTRWPRGEDDDIDDDDGGPDDGGGKGNSRGTKRRRGPFVTRNLLQATTEHANRAATSGEPHQMFPPDEPGMPMDINSNVSHSPIAPPSPTAEVEKANEADTPNPEDQREYSAVPAESRFDVLNNKETIISDLELESVSHAESVEMSVEGLHAVATMAHTSESLPFHAVQSHEDCQSAVVCGDSSIFMMESEEHHGALLSDRLSILAQRLQRLREAPSSTRDEIMPPGDRPRSTPCGLAMSWRTPAGQGAVQQDRHVASVQSVRSAPALCHKGQWSWRDPGHWSPSRACRTGSGGTEGGVHLHDGHGEDLQWEADGTSVAPGTCGLISYL